MVARVEVLALLRGRNATARDVRCSEGASRCGRRGFATCRHTTRAHGLTRIQRVRTSDNRVGDACGLTQDKRASVRLGILALRGPGKSPDGRSSMHATRPWLRFYGSVPATLATPRSRCTRRVAATARRVPEAHRLGFLRHDARPTAQFLAPSIAAPNALAALGLAAGERILISMPTSPQGVIAFYAANKLGAVPALIHPLSTAPEIDALPRREPARASRSRSTRSTTASPAATPKRRCERIILARIPDYLSPLKKLGFWLTKGRKIPPVPADPRVRWWASAGRGRSAARRRARRRRRDDPAAILFSGGTTGAAEGHRAVEPQLHRRGHAGRRLGRHGRGRLDPRDPADLPRLRPRRVRERRASWPAASRSWCRSSPRRSWRSCCAPKRPNLLVGVPTLFDALDQRPVAGARRPVLPARLLLRRRHAAAAGEGALREAGRRARRAGAAARRLRPHRGGDRDHGDAARRISRGLDRHSVPRHARARSAAPARRTRRRSGEEGEICVAGRR